MMKTDTAIRMFLLAVFLLFLTAAFIQIDWLWGINFLYYLPLRQKVIFLDIGIGCFVPAFNRFLLTIYIHLSRFFVFLTDHKATRTVRIAIIFLMFAIIAVFLYYFRVESLYHDSMQAVYFVQRDLSIREIYDSIGNMRNKPLLLFWLSAIKSVFHEAGGFSPYLTLTISSVACGAIFIIILALFVSSLTDEHLERLFLFLLLFSQAISYYFFGYANYYSVIPLFILLYIASANRYIKKATSVLPPLAFLILLTCLHYGTAFMLPSSLFLILHRHRGKIPRLYNALISHPLKFGALPLCITVSIAYIIISSGILSSLRAINSIRPVFVPLWVQGSDPSICGILSPQYLLHLLNIFLLLSPVGIILFITHLVQARRETTLSDFQVFLLLLSSSGICYIVFLMPQSLYAWDIFGWASLGFTLAGSIYFIQSIRSRRIDKYTSVLAVTHALLYFSAWITLNNNVYASSVNYLQNFPAKERNQQVTGVVRTIVEQDPLRDRDAFIQAIQAIESYASNLEDFLYLHDAYHTLGEQAQKERLSIKITDFFTAREKANLNTAGDYFRILQAYDIGEKRDPHNRERFEPLYEKMLLLAPDNPNYHLSYAEYLYAIWDFENAARIFEKTDSLHLSSASTIFNTFAPRWAILVELFSSYVQFGNYESAFRTLMEMRSLDIDLVERKEEPLLYLAIVTFLQTNHLKEARDLLQLSRQVGQMPVFKEEFLPDDCSNPEIDYSLSVIMKACERGHFEDVAGMVLLLSKSNYSPIYHRIRSFVVVFGRYLPPSEDSARLGESEKRTLLNAIRTLASEDKIGYMEALTELRKLQLMFDPESQAYEFVLNYWIYGHTQHFILESQIDSLKLYASKMIECAPEHFYGYVLFGVYNKTMGQYSTAEELFDRAISLAPKSKILLDPKATIERIREIRNDRRTGS